MQNFVYLIGDPASREAVVVDPGWEAGKILAAAREDGLKLTAAFVTHHHFDHVMGLDELLKAVDMPVYVHQDDAPLLQAGRSRLQPVRDGEPIGIGGLRAKAIHTPGHTPGSQCLLVQGHLFTGDTLFINACGRWDLPGGDPARLHASLMHKLAVLPEDTVVHPGHNYADRPTSSIGAEKQTNPFLQVPTTEQFLRLVGR
jgi:glyoxylase-like metal-dependent hydrolase (beta-lactamase superfamily II)